MPKCSIPLQPCQSSQIKEFGYDPATQTLAIRFHAKKTPGSVYTYANVPQDLYDDMVKAESKGKFFGERLKGKADRFPFTKIVEDEEAEAA